MEEDISNAMEQLLDLTISLQTRINQAYSDLCDYTLSQCVISLMKVNVSLDDFISLVSDLELIEDDAKMCTQTITDTASTLKAASEEIDNENHLHLYNKNVILVLRVDKKVLTGVNPSTVINPCIWKVIASKVEWH